MMVTLFLTPAEIAPLYRMVILLPNRQHTLPIVTPPLVTMLQLISVG
jgi:hypothetical protein